MMTAPTTASAPGRLRPGERLAIIAGGGMLPVTLARHMAATRQDAVVFPIVGETAPGEEFSGLPCHPVELEEAGRIRTILKGHGITHLVLAGEIRRRPRLGALRWSMDVVRSLPMVIRALARGDDALLRCVVAVIERGGIRVTGAHEWLPDLVTPSGVLTRRKPAAADRADIAAGVAAAIAIGALDIGQAAVAIGGRAIALEGIEGTDGLLERTIALRNHGRLGGARGGVLVKCCKPGQELRVDLPAIGPRTVRDAAAAGLAGIALQAGYTLILEQQETLALADSLGLFIAGIDAGEIA